MSLRDKNKKVLSEGARERATFQPEPGSAPLRAYQYWLRATEREPFRENFCHFWRVVLIWAPLAFLVHEGLVPFVTSRPMRALGRGVAWVFQKPHQKWKEIPYENRKKICDRIGWTAATIWVLFVLGMLTAAAIQAGLIKTLIAIGIVVGILAVLALFVWIGSKLTEHLRAKKSRLRELRRTDYSAYLAEDDEFLPKKENRLKVFFRNLGDFLVLIANVVRVKKWKICPIVDIQSSSEDGVDTTAPVV